MAVLTKKISIETKGKSDMVDITAQVAAAVVESKFEEGIITVFVKGSTASISTVEYEPGLLKDVPRSLDKFAPYGPDYEHHNTWHDDNGASHVRATLMGPSIVVPFKEKQLLLGTWQQVVLIDFDTRSRTRDVYLTIIGE